MKATRYCQRFYCDTRGDRFCCADCHYLGCRNPCLNDPSRCRLEDTTRKPEDPPARPGGFRVNRDMNAGRDDD